MLSESDESGPCLLLLLTSDLPEFINKLYNGVFGMIVNSPQLTCSH
jgi:hypothetical protein